MNNLLSRLAPGRSKSTEALLEHTAAVDPSAAAAAVAAAAEDGRRRGVGRAKSTDSLEHMRLREGGGGDEPPIVAVRRSSGTGTALVEVALEQYFSKNFEYDPNQMHGSSTGSGMDLVASMMSISSGIGASPKQPRKSKRVQRSQEKHDLIEQMLNKQPATASSSNPRPSPDISTKDALEKIQLEINEIQIVVNELTESIQKRNAHMLTSLQEECHKQHKIVIDMNRLLQLEAQKETLVQDERSLAILTERILEEEKKEYMDANNNDKKQEEEETGNVKLCSKTVSQLLHQVLDRAVNNRTEFHLKSTKSSDEIYKDAKRRLKEFKKRQKEEQTEKEGEAAPAAAMVDL